MGATSISTKISAFISLVITFGIELLLHDALKDVFTVGLQGVLWAVALAMIGIASFLAFFAGIRKLLDSGRG